MSSYQDALILGDFNIPWNIIDNMDTISLMELAELYGLKQHVCMSTHTSGNMLDLMFSTSDSRLIISKPRSSYFISDHCFIAVDISIYQPTVTKKKIMYRKLKGIDNQSFRKSLSVISEKVLAVGNINEAIDLYNNSLKTALDQHAPVQEKIVTLREKVVPWFTKDLEKLKMQLRNLEHVAFRLRNEEFWKEYKHVRATYVKCIKWSKWNYINDCIQEAKGDSSKLFSFVNKLVGKSKQQIYPDGEEQCVADSFAEFFFSKIEKIRDGFEKNCKFVPTEVNCASFDFDMEVTQEEVRAIIRKSKAMTCRNDPVPSYLVKHNNDVLLPVITHIVNLSLRGGVFPDCLKMAIISPLLKKKCLDIIPSNFRPVSNLTYISKIIEKAAAGFFNAHMEREV